MKRPDNYATYDELATSETLGKDFAITCVHGTNPAVLVLAPHGGGIEPGTSQFARRIAGDDFSLYLFEGIKQNGNSPLHITSHNFSEPSCLEMLTFAHTVVAIHGCSGTNRICVGGLDKPLVAALTSALIAAGYPASDTGHEFPARHSLNICNRGASGAGAQLEISRDLRTQENEQRIASSVRSVLVDHYNKTKE